MPWIRVTDFSEIKANDSIRIDGELPLHVERVTRRDAASLEVLTDADYCVVIGSGDVVERFEAVIPA